MSTEKCISGICATVLAGFGIPLPDGTDEPDSDVTALFGKEKIDRAVIYNPDAVAWYLREKYREAFKQAEECSDITVRKRSVMPSVTPVCFASMYTGLMPEKHGIMKYEKPVLTVDTLFDYMLKAGRKCAIVSTAGDSISKIFLERDMDYFIYPSKRRVNRKAASLIKSGAYDLLVVYNPDYDSIMHKHGPEDRRSLRALKANLATYCDFVNLIKKHRKGERVLYGFCPDHGCHEIDGGRGSHGLDMEEDMNVVHLYGVTEK